MLTEFRFDLPEITLQVAEGPRNGPLLLLLHGFTNRWQTFLPILPVLIPSWHVIAFDHRGHGASARDPQGYSAARFYRDAQAVLLRFASQPSVIIGHSMGGSMGLHLAQAHPNLVRAVITGDTSLDLPTHIQVMNTRRNTKLFGLRRRLAGLPYDDLLRRGLTPSTAAEISQLDPAVMDYHATGRVEEFFSDIPDLDFDRIFCPLLLTQANPDKGGLLQDVEITPRILARPATRFTSFDLGHSLNIEDGPTSPFYQAALAFLGQLE